MINRMRSHKSTADVIAGVRRSKVWQRPSLENFSEDWLADEVPVALVFNGIAHVVMMATPRDLPEFALGFCLSEGIITSPQEIYGMDVVSTGDGIEVRIELSSRCFFALKARRRALAGRTGCGVCGVEQLAEIDKSITPLPVTQHFDLMLLDALLPKLRDYQPVGRLTGCTHAAAWIMPEGNFAGGFEDVGRHVALDKLLGARSQHTGWQAGALLISSRASYEMVQKAAMCGVEILLAASAATYLAVRLARRTHMTLLEFAKPGRATVYTWPERLIAGNEQ